MVDICVFIFKVLYKFASLSVQNAFILLSLGFGDTIKFAETLYVILTFLWWVITGSVIAGTRPLI